jgi:hypothetical protein
VSTPGEAEREQAFRERMHRDGDIGEWLTEQLVSSWDPLRFGGHDYRVAYQEEADELGYGGYYQLGTNTETGEPVMVLDETLLIRRESDGQFFEVDIEVSTRPARTSGEVQLELPAEAAS